MSRQQRWLRGVFWGALFLLIANDHVLKGSALVPGWLTGKLSDFAGLIVAPVLVASLLRARSQRAKLACLAAVAAGFASLELVPGWARALEAIDVAGYRVRMWPDVTDLLALAVLPVTWWAMSARAEQERVRLGTPLVHRTAIALASLACVATSSEDVDPLALPLVINNSHAPIDLWVRRYRGDLEACGTGEPRFSIGELQASDFGQPRRRTVAPTEFMELGSGNGEACAAYWIAAPGLDDFILLFDYEGDDPAYNYDTERNSLEIEGPAAELRTFPNPGVLIAETPPP